MRTGEKFVECNEISQRLAHLLPVDGYHIVVHPIPYSLVSVGGDRLCYLTFVVWEYEIHTIVVYIEYFTLVLLSDRIGRASCRERV